MDTRRAIVLAIVTLVLIAAIWAYLILTPEVVAFSPLDAADYLSKTTRIEITFSHQMDPDSVMERLSILPGVAGNFAWEGETLLFTPVKPWATGVEVTVSLAGGAKSKLGLAAQGETTWSFTISPTLLAYLWPSDGSAEIYAFDPIGGESNQLTESGGVLDFDVGPESRLIYYSAVNQQGGSDLFALDRFQDTRVMILPCKKDICADLTVSPNGSMIAFLRNASEVWLFWLEESVVEQISLKGHESRLPLWSPDGQLSYYDTDEEAFIVFDVVTGKNKKIANQTGAVGVWSPGGTAFVAPEMFVKATDILRGPTGEAAYEKVEDGDLEPVRVFTSHLLSYDPDTGATIDLTRDDLTEDISPAFSPDGQRLAFARRYLDEDRWMPGRQLWLMRADGSGQHALTNAPSYKHTTFTWHPGGEQIAVLLFNATIMTDPPEIWLIDIYGNAIRLVVGGYAPQWIP
jgi:hypothetical protein